MLKFKTKLATLVVILGAFVSGDAWSEVSGLWADRILYVEHYKSGHVSDLREVNLAFWKRHNWFRSDNTTRAYSGATFSTGATVVVEQKLFLGSGEAAESSCKRRNMRLPTLDELKEMYEKRRDIGYLTDDGPKWGWPYWSERATNNSDGKDYGYLIYFGDTDQVNKWCENPKSSIGNFQISKGEPVKVYPACNNKHIEQGDVLYVPFGIRSGIIAAFLCVHDRKNVDENKIINDDKYISKIDRAPTPTPTPTEMLH